MPDADTLYAALVARDLRFAGVALVCVTSTGIFCRFGCPARTPLRRNVLFLATVAECQAAGFRACKRCRPDRPMDQMCDQIRGPAAGSASSSN